MELLNQLSTLSLNAVLNEYTPVQVENLLTELKKKHKFYPNWLVSIGAGLACGGFCIQFGCDWIAFFIASISAVLAHYFRTLLTRKGTNNYIGISASTFFGTFIAWGLGTLSLYIPPSSFLYTETPWHPLMACALFVVPGVPLINFISDILDNHIETGLMRAISTTCIISAMSFGIVLAILICGDDNFARNLSMVPNNNYWSYALAAAISAVGFSMIFNTPPRLLIFIALGGIISICTRNLVSFSVYPIELGLGIVVGSTAGSIVLSFICVFVVRKLQLPHQCLAIPSVIPMIPGVLMYRALFAFINMKGVIGEVTTAIHYFTTAALIILGIAIGVAIPNIFLRCVLRTFIIVPQKK